MSLEIAIKVPGADSARMKSLHALGLKSGGLELKPRKSIPLFGGISSFLVDGVHNGIEAGASERGDHIQLQADTRKALAELLAAFGKACPLFTIYAAQAGDLPKRETEVNLSRLLELVGENHIGNRVTYWVREKRETPRGPEEGEET